MTFKRKPDPDCFSVVPVSPTVASSQTTTSNRAWGSPVGLLGSALACMKVKVTTESWNLWEVASKWQPQRQCPQTCGFRMERSHWDYVCKSMQGQRQGLKISPNISDVNKGSGCFSIRSRPGPLCDFLLTPQDSSSFSENPRVYKGMWDGMTVLPQNDLPFAEPAGLQILPALTGGIEMSWPRVCVQCSQACCPNNGLRG